MPTSEPTPQPIDEPTRGRDPRRHPVPEPLHDRELDGVPVFAADPTAPTTTATLVFVVGAVQEPAAHRGALHLLEHLVMTELRHLPLEMDASVGLHTTDFTATGPAPLVAEFLQRLCTLLADPPTARLGVEASVVQIEASSIAPAALLALAEVRSGLTGVGRVNLPEPDPAEIPASAVQELARRWFCRDNALLQLVGELPAETTLPLMAGTRPAAEVELRHRLNPLTVNLVDAEEVAVSFPATVTDAGWTSVVGTELILLRVREELRHRRGLSYDVSSAFCVSAGETVRLVSADLSPHRAKESVRAFVTTIRQLLAEGPTAEELAQVSETLLVGHEDPTNLATRALSAWVDRVLGLDTPTQEPAAVRALTVADLSGWLQRVAQELLWLGPACTEEVWSELGFTGWEPPTDQGPLPAGEVFRAPLAARLMSADARAARLVRDRDALVLGLVDGVVRIELAEVVAVVEHADGVVRVADRRGRTIAVGEPVFRGSAVLLEQLRVELPAAAWYGTDGPRGLGD